MYLIDKYYAYKKQKELGFIESVLKKSSNNGIDNTIQKFVLNKKKKLLKIASQNTPYYNNLFQKEKINYNQVETAFVKLPLLTKDIIRSNYNDLINHKEKDFYPINTGGSTGQPLNFEVSNYAASVDSIHQKFQYSLIGYSKHKDEHEYIANFGGSLIPQIKTEKNIFWLERKYNLPYGKIYFSALYLNRHSIVLYINKLNQIKPTILRGYPSFLNDLATYININNVKLSFKVKGVLLTSEMIHKAQIENISKAFNCKITCQYGLSEVCLFSFTKDEKMNYLCSPLYGFTEILDNEGRHVEIGEEGDVVATSYYNYRMPFIRYKTGDRAVFGGYENNHLVIKELKGRSQDFIVKKNGERISLTAVIFGVHLKAFDAISKWQIHQSKPGQIILKIIKSNKYSLSDEEEIRDVLKKTSGIVTLFNYVDEIEKTKSGKSLFLIQDCKI